jgi:hypothetical protein
VVPLVEPSKGTPSALDTALWYLSERGTVRRTQVQRCVCVHTHTCSHGRVPGILYPRCPLHATKFSTKFSSIGRAPSDDALPMRHGPVLSTILYNWALSNTAVVGTLL